MENSIKENKNDLTKGSIWTKLLAYFLPIALGTIFQQLYNAADGVIVGKFVGTEALAAVGGSAGNVSGCVINMLIALASGGSVIVAQFFGAGDQEKVSKAIHTAITFAALCGVVFAAICWFAAPGVLILMKTPADTLDLAVSYLRIVGLGAPFLLTYNMGASILRALGDSRKPFIYLVICCLLNIGLDMLFVIVFKLAVAGVAIATALSMAISMFLVLGQMRRDKGPSHLDLKKLGIRPDFLKRIVKIGGPTCLQSVFYSITNILIQVGVNTLGTVIVAGWALSGKVDGIYWGLIAAAGTAICNFTGQNYGAGESERIRKSIKIAFILFMGITIVCSALLLSFGRGLIKFFTDDPGAQEATWHVVTYFVPYYFVWTVIEVLSGIMRGMGIVRVPVLITAFGICGFRLIWIYTAFRQWHTLFVLSMSYPISWVIAAIALIIYYRTGKWRKTVFEQQIKTEA